MRVGVGGPHSIPTPPQAFDFGGQRPESAYYKGEGHGDTEERTALLLLPRERGTPYSVAMIEE